MNKQDIEIIIKLLACVGFVVIALEVIYQLNRMKKWIREDKDRNETKE